MIWTRSLRNLVRREQSANLRRPRLRFETLEDRVVPAISIVNSSPYLQDFDSLITSGTNQPWANNSTLAGWSLFNKTGAAITNYTASDGSSFAGSFYSFGTGTNPERALGGIGSGGAYWGSPASGTVAGWMAVAFTNNSGNTINEVTISFDGEQWRNAGNTTKQTMVFEYGFGENFSDVTSWIAPGGTFNFESPIATATASALDGNDPANRVAALGGKLTSLNWLTGAPNNLWLRWVEVNDAGNDHGLAIDNFSFAADTTPGTMTSTVIDSITPLTANIGENITFSASVTALSGSATPTGTVEFRDGTFLLASAPVTGSGPTGTAVAVTNTIPFGTYSNIKAHFLATGAFVNSTSATFAKTLTINANPTKLSLSSDKTNPSIGTDITFTATVTSTAGTPTGSVDFFANGLKLNATPVALDTAGKASFLVNTAAVQTTGSLTPGINDISAKYNPTGIFLASADARAQRVQPNAFSPGQLLVYRVGDGVNTMTPNGNRFFIDVYDTSPSQTQPLQSIIMPTLADGDNKPVLASGQQSTEGQITISPDGKFAYFTAYNALPTNTSPLHTATAVSIPRVVARLNLINGNIETSMALTDVSSGFAYRTAVAAADGSIYTAGNGGSIAYVPAYSPTTTTSTNLGDSLPWQSLRIFGSTPQLYGMTPSNAAGTNPKIARVGTGLPTSGPVTPVGFPGIPLGQTIADTPRFPVEFYLADLSPTVDFAGGIDTMYISENGPSFSNGTLTKWTWDPTSSTWTLTSTINAPGILPGVDNSVNRLAGVTSGGAVTLYVTNGAGGTNTGGGTLWTVTDTAGYGAAFSTTTLTQLAQEGLGSLKAFRGVAVVPTLAVPPTTVLSFTVNNGAIQRSRLTTIDVNFSGPVTPSMFTGLGNITLTRTAAAPPGVVGTVVQTGAVGANGLITVTQPGPATSLRLTFSNADGSPESAGVQYGSLADGRWQMAIPSAGFTSTLNDVTLRRLFGDYEIGSNVSNGVVDSSDFADFGGVFGSSPGVGVSPYDFDNNGVIDSTDFAAFGSRFGVSL